MMRCVMVILLSLAAASEASADSWVAPFLGVNFGGDAGGRFDDIASERQPLTLGLGIGGMSDGVLGVELDFAYSNRFFGKKSVVSEANHVMTIVPTLLLSTPAGDRGNVRPYLELGVGWLQRKLRVDGIDIYANENDLAFTLGGGLIGFFGDHVGMRGDYRYLRAFGNDNLDELLRLQVENKHFGFSRFSLGAVLRF